MQLIVLNCAQTFVTINYLLNLNLVGCVHLALLYKTCIIISLIISNWSY